jgi:predicted DNA-binding transcriptional regulator AlpA
MIDRLLTRAELAEWLGVTRQWLDAIASRPDAPPCVQLGRAIRYDRQAVKEWLDRHSSPPPVALC